MLEANVQCSTVAQLVQGHRFDCTFWSILYCKSHCISSEKEFAMNKTIEKRWNSLFCWKSMRKKWRKARRRDLRRDISVRTFSALLSSVLFYCIGEALGKIWGSNESRFYRRRVRELVRDRRQVFLHSGGLISSQQDWASFRTKLIMPFK